MSWGVVNTLDLILLSDGVAANWVGVIVVGWRGLFSMHMSIECYSKTKGNRKFKGMIVGEVWEGGTVQWPVDEPNGDFAQQGHLKFRSFPD